jgi:hypothetical protein
MKSIKEKADEYARDYLFNSLPQRAPNVHFEAGANYVVEQIEKLIFEKHVEGNLPLFDLTKMIDKLKEK